MEEKKWYESKKFWTVIVTAMIGAGNEAFDWGISTDQGLSMMVFALAYVLIQAGLDWYKEKRGIKDVDPLAMPMVREAIESLVNEFYDYQAARADGISVHAKEVKKLIIESLDELITAELYDKLKDNADVVDEIIRQVLKLYNQDVKMVEGADLARSSMPMVKKAE
jgi:hypothetical protein